MRVNKGVVKDYQSWVKLEDEMWLDKIARKIQQMEYTTGAQFRGDFEKIYINALAYNTEGHGELATPSKACFDQPISYCVLRVFLPHHFVFCCIASCSPRCFSSQAIKS